MNFKARAWRISLCITLRENVWIEEKRPWDSPKGKSWEEWKDSGNEPEED